MRRTASPAVSHNALVNVKALAQAAVRVYVLEDVSGHVSGHVYSRVKECAIRAVEDVLMLQNKR